MTVPAPLSATDLSAVRALEQAGPIGLPLADLRRALGIDPVRGFIHAFAKRLRVRGYDLQARPESAHGPNGAHRWVLVRSPEPTKPAARLPAPSKPVKRDVGPLASVPWRTVGNVVVSLARVAGVDGPTSARDGRVAR